MMCLNVSYASPNQPTLNSDSCPANTRYVTHHPHGRHWPHGLSSQEQDGECANEAWLWVVGPSVYVDHIDRGPGKGLHGFGNRRWELCHKQMALR